MPGIQQQCSGQSAVNLRQYGAGHQSDNIIPESEESTGRSRSSSRDGPVKVSFHLDSDDPGFASNSSDSGKAAGRTHNHMLRYVSTAAKRTLHKNPLQDRDIILRIQDLKDMIPKDEQARKMCIATELTLILPNEPEIDLVMNQGVEAMITGTEGGEIMNDGLVHPTASRVAQDLRKEDHMTGVDSPREPQRQGSERKR